MGFRPQQTIYNLTFEGTAFDGLHVKMSCCTIKEHNTMIKGAINGDDKKGITEETINENEYILDLFANHLLSWNLEDPIDGSPVPATRVGIDSQERSLIAQLIGSWQIAMVKIPNLSNTESSNGETSEEASLDLGSISESQQN